MKISELIETASKALMDHGDIPVIVKDAGCGCCSMGNGLAAEQVISDVWVYDLDGGPGEIPLAFMLEG
ncbi:hypothetical protein [Streptomyces ardesiacus]|uniref:hypothetical protein n=1 Tax=Streptomyces ardesiacus TaxID=285564 RepID=UPI00364B3033